MDLFKDIRGGEFGFAGDWRSSGIDNKKERERDRETIRSERERGRERDEKKRVKY